MNNADRKIVKLEKSLAEAIERISDIESRLKKPKVGKNKTNKKKKPKIAETFTPFFAGPKDD